MVSRASLDTFLNYDFSVSARQTKKVLAIVEEKVDGRAQKVLKEIDLKTIGFLKKFILCITGSYRLQNVAQLVHENHATWWKETAQTGKELSKEQCQIEKQCAWLGKKTFRHNYAAHMRSMSGGKTLDQIKTSPINFRNPYAWTLDVQVHCPLKTDAEQNTLSHHPLPVDRLTTWLDIRVANNDLVSVKYTLAQPVATNLTNRDGTKFSITYVCVNPFRVFADSILTLPASKKSAGGLYFHDEEKGGDQVIQYTFSNVRQVLLEEEGQRMKMMMEDAYLKSQQAPS